MAKHDTLRICMTKTPEKPYSLGPHIPMQPIYGSTAPLPLEQIIIEESIVIDYCRQSIISELTTFFFEILPIASSN